MGENLIEWVLGIVSGVVVIGIVGGIVMGQTVAVLKSAFSEFKQEYTEARKGHALLHEHERNEFGKDYDHLHVSISGLRDRVGDNVTNEKLNTLRHEENSKRHEETNRRLMVITDKLEKIEGKK